MAQPAASRPKTAPRPRAERYQITVVLDVRTLVGPDLATVDALARMALVARRLGYRVELRDAAVGLRELLALVGLAEVLACGAGSGVESKG